MADVTAPAVQSTAPAPAQVDAASLVTPPTHDQNIGPSVSPPQPETPANQNGITPDLRAEALRQTQEAAAAQDPSNKIATLVAKLLKKDLAEIKDLLHEILENTSHDEADEEDAEFIDDDAVEDDEEDETADEAEVDDEDMGADADAVAVETEAVSTPSKRKTRR